jgi:hypothetical protein
VLRTLMVAVTTVLMTAGFASAAHASNQPVFTVWDGSGNEYYKTCANTPPYSCGTFNGSMAFQITVANQPQNTAVTVNYRIEDITTTAGLDYPGPTTGSIVIPAGWGVGWVSFPVTNDGVAEPDETLRVRITSTSVGGNFTDTGLGTLYNGGTIPEDCTLSRPDSLSFSMTCTNRPATQRWQVEVTCGRDWPRYVYVRGPIVTGSGTSGATCAGTGHPFLEWTYYIL